MHDSQKRPTIENIANESGVSIATVSRVLNKSDKVKKETADRVLKVVNRLNYQTDRVARRMRVKNSDSLIIGLIITDIGNPFFSELARGVEDIAYENNHAVLISSTDEDPEKENFYINSMLAEKVSGIIIAPTVGNYDMLKNLSGDGYPLICVDRYPEHMDVDTVSVNNENGAYQSIQQLIKLGHERIGIINGIRGLSTTTRRFEGYKRALKEANIPLDEELIIYEDSKQGGGKAGTRKLLNLENPPTAVFSTNNLMSLGFFEEVYSQNLKIPEDISLIGFDDMSWATALNPPLTAVRQPARELGMTATELLLKRLNEPYRKSLNIVLNPELIMRKSCECITKKA